MKVKILKYTAVATWRWKQGAEDDVCGICQSEFEATCPNDDCKYPGESCPVVAGVCTHTFHKHCVDGWLNDPERKGACPMCRQPYKIVLLPAPAATLAPTTPAAAATAASTSGTASTRPQHATPQQRQLLPAISLS